MEVISVFAVLVLLYSSCKSACAFSDGTQPQMFMAPGQMEFRAVKSDNKGATYPYVNTKQFPRPEQQIAPMTHQQPLLHNAIESTPPAKTVNPSMPTADNKKVDFGSFMRALNDIVENTEDENEQRRAAAASDYDYHNNPPYPNAAGYTRPSSTTAASSYGYSQQPPNYNAGSKGPSSTYVPAVTPHHTPESKFSLLSDLIGIDKAPATKLANKVSGLISLGLALLTGSAPDDLELRGFMDIIVNGIVKPLILAKGGLKAIISKLTIPVISLLLINLELLVTVWWLWEDCTPPPVIHPVPAYPIPAYPKPAYRFANYNDYY